MGFNAEASLFRHQIIIMVNTNLCEFVVAYCMMAGSNVCAQEDYFTCSGHPNLPFWATLCLARPFKNKQGVHAIGFSNSQKTAGPKKGFTPLDFPTAKNIGIGWGLMVWGIVFQISHHQSIILSTVKIKTGLKMAK